MAARIAAVLLRRSALRCWMGAGGVDFARTGTWQVKNMVAETEGARRWARWDAGGAQPGWIGILGNLAVLLAAGGAALADPESVAEFERLRSRAAAGVRAIAALPLREGRGASAGWFNVSVNPIAGRPGYSFWNVQDITARHEMEAVIRDERNKLLDF